MPDSAPSRKRRICERTIGGSCATSSSTTLSKVRISQPRPQLVRNRHEQKRRVLATIEGPAAPLFMHLDSMPDVGVMRTEPEESLCKLESLRKRGKLKIYNKNKGLRLDLDHSRVLFVQHPSKNALHQAFSSGSFVACAFPFSNCERATEGGIPRSSRFSWFA